MNRRNKIVYRLSWRREHLFDLFAVCVVIGGLLCGRYLLGKTTQIDDSPPVNSKRVSQVKERIDPNTASAGSLRRLPGIGPVLASAIVEYRSIHGEKSFRRLEDLQKVKGIGPVIVRRVAPDLHVAAK